MAYTKNDVGPKMVGGVAVPLSDTEATVMAAKWNAEEPIRVAKQAADNARESRLTALSVLISDSTATLADALEYTSLRDGLEI